MTTLVAPPPTDRGVQKTTTTTGGLDWLEGSIRGVELETLRNWLTSEDDGDWVTCERGASGYANQERSAWGVTILHDPRRLEIHFKMTGKVLASWPRSMVHALCIWLLTHGATFSRVDSQVTVPYELATVEDFLEAWDTGTAVAHASWSSFTCDKSRTASAEPEATRGRTWMLGAPSSLRRARIYDKGAESGGAIEGTRIELQERDEAADEAVRQYVGDNYGDYFAARLVSFIDFREHDDSNTTRRTRAAWYAALVGACVAAAAYAPTEPRTVEAMVSWMERSVGPLLAALVAGGHVTMHELLYDGAQRWRSKHQQVAGLTS